ncbi:MAG: DUF3187 family protein [Gammaproteobacteria bacterium]|jgi:hypothetical protein|nr:DUF3187 family protein [Gammaproteobacteria bacterium]
MRRIIFFIVFLMCFPWEALADDPVVDAFPLRNHNPFLQVFGLPKFQTDELVRPDKIDFAISYDIANDADDAERAGGDLVIDGEMQTLSLSLRRRAFDRMEFGIDVPYVSHSGGSLDGLIKDWHNLVGLSNSMREGPNDQIQHSYALDGITRYELLVPQSGIGDVQLSAAYAMESVTFRASIKLPTGDPDKLTGSGATDVSLGLYAGSTTMLFDRAFDYSGFLGVLALGDGDVLPDFQESTVPYGGVALRWHVTERLSLATQFSLQGSYFDIDIDEIGGSTIQFAIGGDYRFERTLLRLAIVEDVAAGATPDFALHLSIRSFGG